MTDSPSGLRRRFRRVLKRSFGRFIFESGLYRAMIRNQAIVVAFHRVNDKGSSVLNCTVSDFENFCDFFRRFFNVTSLKDIVERLHRGGSFERHLAITFDDGYEDTYLNAAPILRRTKMPATFFVTTGFVETRKVPWWDEQTGEQHPWMTWQQVAELSEEGFDIGAHTESHSDLTRLSLDSARVEIRSSKGELERRLKREVDLFAYPYGGREHISDKVLKVVREEAFRCCCSCFGGVNLSTTDPYRIKRVGIDTSYGTAYELGFNLAVRRT